jgi:hypothetical protein
MSSLRSSHPVVRIQKSRFLKYLSGRQWCAEVDTCGHDLDWHKANVLGMTVVKANSNVALGGIQERPIRMRAGAVLWQGIS